MPRLDPAHPPLWRTPTTLQFGVDPVAIVVEPEPWQERLVRELEKGIPDAALEPVATAFGAPPGAGERFVQRIARALEMPRARRGGRVVVQTPDGFPASSADAFAQAMADAGFDVRRETWFDVGWSHDPDDAPVVVLAHHLVEPRRAAALMSRDAVHLPVVFTGDAVELGPLVRPGRTACLACVAAHRRDADPAWPLLAAQLLGRPCPDAGRTTFVEAGIAAAGLLNDAEQSPEVRIAHSVTLRAGSLRRTTRSHRPHAACRCRSLEGIATPIARAVPAPTTARAFARPA
ncbi:hypothetical protein FHS08_003255 [Microbacterium ulmi]|nr:hypothetical protein [Microbacterium ulmi]